MEFSYHELKTLLIFQEGTDKAQKQTKNQVRRNFLSLYSSKA